MESPGPCYVYGFLRAPHPPLPPLVGVFGAAVETVTEDGVSAVISVLPGVDLRAGRDDLLAHSDVLQAIVRDRDVVPVHFGSIYPDGFSVEELPRSQLRSLRRLLDDLAGRVEVQVKATYDADAITRALVESDSRLRRLRSARQDYKTQVALGSRFAEVLERRRAADANAVAKQLARLTDRVAADPPAGEWGAFRLAFLVERRKLADLESALDRMAAELDPVMTVTWVGPLPPYSFVADTSSRRAG